MSTLIQVTPCSDWFYVEWNEHSLDWNVMLVAAWGLTSEGRVVGLVPASGSRSGPNSTAPQLVPAPSLGGTFVHESKLSEKQRDLARARVY